MGIKGNRAISGGLRAIIDYSPTKVLSDEKANQSQIQLQSPERVIVLPPSSPGSKGDEGMMLGAVTMFSSGPIVVLNPDRCPKIFEPLLRYLNPGNVPTWSQVIAQARLKFAACPDISEIRGPIHKFAPVLRPSDVVLCLGADLLDGTCGVGAALRRLDFMYRAQQMGIRVTAVCSFRQNVNRRIVAKIKMLTSCQFYLRDSESFANFNSQVGMPGKYFPDISTIFDAQGSTLTGPGATGLARIRELRTSDTYLVGLNFSEQSFRSFYNLHSNFNRRKFVASVIQRVFDRLPEGHVVLISNDVRNWFNLPSDARYQQWAKEFIDQRYGVGRCSVWEPTATYPENIVLMGALDFVITGRMHLAHATVRSNNLPLILMGQGKGYSSYNKMTGMYESFLGTSKGVVTKIEDLPEAINWLLQSKTELLAKLETRNAELRREKKALLPEFKLSLGLN